MTLSGLRTKIITCLTPSVGEREARAMASHILEHLYGITAVDIAVNPDRCVEEQTVKTIDNIVSRVAGGEPLQYVLGIAPFHGLEIAVKPGVLIPRPETSELVDLVVDFADGRPDLSVLDVCTGSGCIAVALARSLRFADITAADIDETALSTARLNNERLKTRVSIEKCDVLNDVFPGGPYDIIVSNPPYIDESERKDMDSRVLDHEPSSALFVPDNNPLVFYRAIADQGLTILKNGGGLFFEINPRHVRELCDMLTTMGYKDTEPRRDFNGKYRFISAIR